MQAEEARLYIGLRVNMETHEAWTLLDKIAARELLKEIHRLHIAVSAQRHELDSSRRKAERRQRHGRTKKTPTQKNATLRD